jgi:hypothetical protein
MATFWLAMAKVGSYHSSRLVAVVCSVLSANLHWCSSTSWASMAACSLASSPHRCTAPRSMSSYIARCHSS